ncbi:MAG: carboxypeptidase regulatory-like domain-containing protein [Bacteroidales bacterium]|nr:carboxypeptidase regulatory-like domain-containing protein [Bacteroidales bacterium]
MKKLLLSVTATLLALGASAALPKDVRIYINPGHGSWGGEDRHMGTVTHGGPTYTDTAGFYESNTNLEKGFGMLEKLIEYGVPFDRTKNQSNSNPARLGAALDLSQTNLVMSRVKNGPYPHDGSTYGAYSRNLSEIAAECESWNADIMISIHSNAATEGTNTNYPLFLYRGYTNSEQNAGSSAAAKACWPHWWKNQHMMWTNYSATNMNIQGDWTFMSSWGTQGYGILRHSVPGFLVEGYFHTYQPARHKAMNWDACRWEGQRYAKGFNDYLGFGKTDNYGTIYGVLRDGEQTFSHTYYTPNASTLDKWKPINNATVTLKNSNGEVVQTYKTDDEYNGVFVFDKVPAGTYSLTYSHPEYKEFSQSVTVTANETTFPTPLFETEQIPARGHYAYGLSSTNSGSNYTLKFKSTGDVDNASIIFTNNSTGATQSIKTGAIKKGENTVTVDSKTLGENATFSWSVAINNPVSTGVELLYSDNSIVYNNGSANARIGVAIDKDPTSANFGTIYTLTAMGQGMQKYNPDFSKNGGKVITGMFGKDTDASTSSNKFYRSNRLEVNKGKVYIANYANNYTGIWEYDPVTNSTPKNLSGTTYYERAVAIVGEGSSRKVFTSHENNLQRFDIGTGTTWTSGSPAKSYTTAGIMDNGDGDVLVTDKAVFVSQNRYAGNNLSQNPAFAVFDHDLNLISKSDAINATLNGSENGGMAISSDYKTFAIADSYTSSGRSGVTVQVYDVTWNGSTPTFVHKQSILLDGTYRVDQMEFDYADNLYIASQQKGLLVYAIKNPARQTVTKATSTIQGQAMPAVPGRYAYNLNMTKQNECEYTLTFTSTGDIESASVVLTPTNGGETKTVQINGVNKGQNTVTIDATTLEGNVEYNWAIAFNNPASPSVELIHSDNSIIYNNGTNDARIGVAIDNDETSTNFGTIYTITAMGQGLQKFNPDLSKNGGKLITGMFGKDTDASTSTNKFVRSNRLEVENGKVYIANYANMNSGMWEYDPATNASPRNITNAFYERALAFYGEGSSRKVFSSHENNLQRFDIGTSTSWTSGSPIKSYTTAGVLDNGDGDILVTDKAVIVSQNRFAGNNLTQNPAFAVFDHDLNLKFRSDAINATLNGSDNGGMTISADYKTFAIADSYTGSGRSGVSVQVYSVTWNGATPTFTHKFAIPLDGTYRVDQMEFDYAGNLVIASQQKGLLVYAVKTDARTTTTHAATNSLIKGVAATPVTNLKATRQCYGEGSNTEVGTVDVEITWTGQENNRENLNNYKVYYQTMRRDSLNNRVYDDNGTWNLAGTASIDFTIGETGSFTHKNITYGSDDNGNYDRIYNYKVVPYNITTDSEGAEAVLEGKNNTITVFYPSAPIDVILSQPYVEKDINEDGENEKLYTFDLKLDITLNDNFSASRLDDADAMPSAQKYVIVVDEATAKALNAASNAAEIGIFEEGPDSIVANNCNHHAISGWNMVIDFDDIKPNGDLATATKSIRWENVNPSLTYKPQVYLISTRAFNFTSCEAAAIEFALPAAEWTQDENANNIIPIEDENITSLAGNEDMPIGSFRKVGDIETATNPVEITKANVIGTNGATLNPLAVSDDVINAWNISYTFELKDSEGNIISTQTTNTDDPIYSNTDSIAVDVLGLGFGYDESVAPDGRTRYTYNAEKNQAYKLVVRTTYSREFNGEEVVLSNETENDIAINPSFPNPIIDPYKSPGYLFYENVAHNDTNGSYEYYYDACVDIAWEDFNDNLARYMGYFATPKFTCEGHPEGESSDLVAYHSASVLTDAQIDAYNERINQYDLNAPELTQLGYNESENWSTLASAQKHFPIKVHYVWAGNEKLDDRYNAEFEWELSAGYPVIVFDAPLFRINARPENGIYELNSDNTNGKNMHVITTVNDSYKTLVMDGIVEAQATGVEDVNINNNGNNIYYNLQGVKVANPSNGIFIKVDGTKAARVFVK